MFFFSDSLLHAIPALSSSRQTLPVFGGAPSGLSQLTAGVSCHTDTTNVLKWLDSLRKVIKYRNGHTKQQRMWLKGLLIVFLSSNHLVYSFSFDGVNTDTDTDIDMEEDWDSMENFTLSEDGGGGVGGDDDDLSNGFVPQFKTGLSGSEKAKIKPLILPGSVRISASMLHKELFTPEIGNRPVPSLVKSILLPEMAARKPVQSVFSPVSDMVEVKCYMDRIIVRVLKSLFTYPSAWRDLKLGTCAVNKATATHYYFVYYLKGCEITRGVGDGIFLSLLPVNDISSDVICCFISGGCQSCDLHEHTLL